MNWGGRDELGREGGSKERKEVGAGGAVGSMSSEWEAAAIIKDGARGVAGKPDLSTSLSLRPPLPHLSPSAYNFHSLAFSIESQ